MAKYHEAALLRESIDALVTDPNGVYVDATFGGGGHSAEIIKRLDNIENDLSNINSQLNENTQIVKALLHRSDELDAKYDCLLHTTATKDAITSLDTKFDILNDRLFQQETRLLVLAKAK